MSPRTPHPSFEIAATATAAHRLLLLTYHFPPGQEVGALRWQKFARHLAARGCALDVVTLHPDAVPRPDLSRLYDLPAGTRVFGVHAPRPVAERIEYGLWLTVRGLRWAKARIRPTPPTPHEETASAADRHSARASSRSRAEAHAHRFDRRELARAVHVWVESSHDAAWANAAGSIGGRLAASRRYDAVVSCGPPHKVHEAARRVARSTGRPLVVDLRDPWSLVERLPDDIASPRWWAHAARDERRVFRQAALIVANTEQAATAMRAQYPELSTRIITVTNGYDDDETLPAAAPTGRFVIAYAGSIYIDRDPRLLFRAASHVVRSLALTPHEFGIELIGNVDSYGGVPVDVIAREEGIASFVQTGPPRVRRDAFDFLARATMLVSLPQDSVSAIPSKVFEYMRFPAWLLILAGRDSATGQLLRSTNADVVDPHDVDAIASAIARRVEEYQAGARPTPVSQDTRFSRRHQAATLWRALQRYCDIDDRSGGGATPGIVARTPAKSS